MKDIKDYLHLYFGCEVRTEDKVFAKKTIYGRTGTFIGFTDHTRLHCRIAHRAGPEGQVMVFLLKPILRPLSNMTEEEAIEIAKVSEWEPHFRDVKVERTQYNDLVVKWDGMIEGGEQQNVTGDCFYCAEQFQLLLSKGFDLFGLIELGLAIDKTKLNSEQNDERSVATEADSSNVAGPQTEAGNKTI